ncbi:tripartite tricarboxylate transporter substrate binding protein [Roseomonas sp. KE2513]|uniref:Bug family tripartite tricarboxylate transporter substrate binding protein n=1 Tax=Roseomonas sp. KE2513 TaxID=2479202 RepID=UPI0018DF4246|nr:tripartite tricarboxylate transporter substrate binding protein [Roseomonas sp. KE2513]
MYRFSRRQGVLAGIGVGLAAPSVRAQPAWPSRPVRIVVPYAPGGGTDVTNRAIAEALGRELGQPFVVENRAGANGIIGAEAVARSQPDGYSFVAPNGTHAMLRHITPQLPFDPIADFTPVAMLASYCFVLVCPANSAFRDVRGVIDRAREKPGDLAQGTADVASGYVASRFSRAAGVEMTEVRYSGSGASVGDLTGGHLPMAWFSTATAMTLLPGGSIRALAVTSPRRSTFLPDTPSLSELGVGEASYTGWFGLFGPAKLPDAITTRLNTAVNAVVQSPSVQERLKTLAVETYITTPAEMASVVAEDDQRWAQAIKDGTLRRS